MFSCRISCFYLKRKFYFYTLLFLGGITEHVQVDLALNPNGEPESGQNNIERKIILKGEFTEDQHKRLLKVAESCPVHKLLTSNISIQSELSIG
jgi:putative redox protein